MQNDIPTDGQIEAARRAYARAREAGCGMRRAHTVAMDAATMAGGVLNSWAAATMAQDAYEETVS